MTFIIIGIGTGYLLSILLNTGKLKLFHFIAMGVVGGLLGRFIHVGFLDMPMGFYGDVIFCLGGSFLLTEAFYLTAEKAEN